MCEIPEDLGTRYFEMLHQDANNLSLGVTDLAKSDSLLQKYKYKFNIYKENALIFEDMFHNPSAPLIKNSGNYEDFKQQVESFISLVQNKLDNHLFSNKDQDDIWKSADKLDDIYFEMTGK